jgi:hypothetical protein
MKSEPWLRCEGKCRRCNGGAMVQYMAAQGNRGPRVAPECKNNLFRSLEFSHQFLQVAHKLLTHGSAVAHNIFTEDRL